MSIAEGLSGIFEDPSLLSRVNIWSQTQKFQVAGKTNYAVINPNGHTFIGVYDSGNALYYGISPGLPAPPGTAAVGGYYGGLGIGGSVDDTSNQPIFGVLASNQSSNGIGNTAFTVYANGVIESFWVQLGAKPVASTPTIASGTVYQNTSSSYQTLYIPITYSPTSTAAATAAVALGTADPPAAAFTNSEPAGVAVGRVDTITLRVPPQWYYSVTVTNATIGTVTQIQE